MVILGFTEKDLIMESPDRTVQERNEDRGDDPRPSEGPAADGEDLRASPQVVGTFDPFVASGPGRKLNLEAYPNETMVIETNQIREPDEGYPSNLVLVPVEIGNRVLGRQGNGTSKDDEGYWGRGERGALSSA